MSDRVASRRMKFAGHCNRHLELPAGRLVLWELSRACGQTGHRSKGEPTATFVEVLAQDAGVERALWSWPDVWMKEKIGKYVCELV